MKPGESPFISQTLLLGDQKQINFCIRSEAEEWGMEIRDEGGKIGDSARMRAQTIKSVDLKRVSMF